MKTSRSLAPAFVVASILAAGVAPAHAHTPIPGGVYNATILVGGDDVFFLQGDVQCDVPAGTPCIQFTTADVKLELRGYVITGQAPATACFDPYTAPVAGEDGIDTNFQNWVTIEGPGLVRRFRGNGILMNGGKGVTTAHVTVSTNCHHGILSSSVSGKIHENTVVKNCFSTAGETAACGGITVAGTSHSVMQNEVDANRYTGIGVFGHKNTVEVNDVGGSCVGYYVDLGAGASGANRIRTNQAWGNGCSDFYNAAPAGQNLYTTNTCETAAGIAEPALPCPKVHYDVVGHKHSHSP